MHLPPASPLCVPVLILKQDFWVFDINLCLNLKSQTVVALTAATAETSLVVVPLVVVALVVIALVVVVAVSVVEAVWVTIVVTTAATIIVVPTKEDPRNAMSRCFWKGAFPSAGTLTVLDVSFFFHKCRLHHLVGRTGSVHPPGPVLCFTFLFRCFGSRTWNPITTSWNFSLIVFKVQYTTRKAKCRYTKNWYK